MAFIIGFFSLENLFKYEVKNEINSLFFLDKIIMYGRFTDLKNGVQSIIQLPYKVKNHISLATSWHSNSAGLNYSISADVNSYNRLQLMGYSNNSQNLTGFFIVIGDYVA